MSCCTCSTTRSCRTPRRTLAEDQGHVCDSTADVLSTGTSHPSARLSDAVLDVGHDDYYDHNGSWWDIRDSRWLVHLESARAAHHRGRRHRRRRHLDTRRQPVRRFVHEALRRRYAVHLVAIEHTGFRLLSWGGACSGTSRTCDTTVESGGAAVTATFGPAVTVTARTRGPGHIMHLDGTRAWATVSWI